MLLQLKRAVLFLNIHMYLQLVQRMMLHRLPLFLIIVLLPTVFHLTNGISVCPQPSLIEPCIRSHYYKWTTFKFRRTVECRDLTSNDVLDRVLRGIKNCPIKELKITSSAFRFFKAESFNGTWIDTISISNSSLQALTDRESAFLGLEQALTKLKVQNVSFVNDWKWDQLQKLQQLKALYINFTDLSYLSDGFKNLSTTLEVISLNKNFISEFADRIFQPFLYLKVLELRENGIHQLQRKMFPMPALNLLALDVSKNALEHLPKDLFFDMPALAILDLSANRITTLDSSVFENLIPNLKYFTVADSPIICDCGLLWIIGSKAQPKMDKVYCNKPDRIKGKPLSTLFDKDLSCHSESFSIL